MKKSIYYLVPLLALGLLIFFACKKEFSELESSQQNHYRPKISGLYSTGNISINNGVLCFNDISDFNTTLAEFRQIDSLFELDTSIVEDSAFILFENDMGFNSLRKSIANQLNYLESIDALYDNNDPDDHFIVEDDLRTVLNPNCEVMVGNIIYTFINPYILLKINDDWDALDLVRGQNILEAISDNNVNIVQYYYPTLGIITAHFSIEINNKTVTFTNQSENADESYWTFGDDQASTSESPVHTYASYGRYTATLVISKTLPDGYKLYSEKSIEIELDKCNAIFKYAQSGLDATFNDLSTPDPNGATEITFWSWNFGDGNSLTTVNPQIGTDPSHRYDHPGDYPVTLIIQDDLECSDTMVDTVRILPTCCFRNGYAKDKIPSQSGNVKMKYKGKSTFIPGFFNNITAKTVCLTKKSNGSWKHSKADSVIATVHGWVYRVVDETRCSDNDNLRYVTVPDAREHNRKKAKTPDNKIGFGFQVGCELLYFHHRVIKNGETITYDYTMVE